MARVQFHAILVLFSHIHTRTALVPPQTPLHDIVLPSASPAATSSAGGFPLRAAAAGADATRSEVRPRPLPSHTAAAGGAASAPPSSSFTDTTQTALATPGAEAAAAAADLPPSPSRPSQPLTAEQQHQQRQPSPTNAYEPATPFGAVAAAHYQALVRQSSPENVHNGGTAAPPVGPLYQTLSRRRRHHRRHLRHQQPQQQPTTGPGPHVGTAPGPGPAPVTHVAWRRTSIVVLPPADAPQCLLQQQQQQLILRSGQFSAGGTSSRKSVPAALSTGAAGSLDIDAIFSDGSGTRHSGDGVGWPHCRRRQRSPTGGVAALALQLPPPPAELVLPVPPPPGDGGSASTSAGGSPAHRLLAQGSWPHARLGSSGDAVSPAHPFRLTLLPCKPGSEVDNLLSLAANIFQVRLAFCCTDALSLAAGMCVHPRPAVHASVVAHSCMACHVIMACTILVGRRTNSRCRSRHSAASSARLVPLLRCPFPFSLKLCVFGNQVPSCLPSPLHCTYLAQVPVVMAAALLPGNFFIKLNEPMIAAAIAAGHCSSSSSSNSYPPASSQTSATTAPPSSDGTAAAPARQASRPGPVMPTARAAGQAVAAAVAGARTAAQVVGEVEWQLKLGGWAVSASLAAAAGMPLRGASSARVQGRGPASGAGDDGAGREEAAAGSGEGKGDPMVVIVEDAVTDGRWVRGWACRLAAHCTRAVSECFTLFSQATTSCSSSTAQTSRRVSCQRCTEPAQGHLAWASLRHEILHQKFRFRNFTLTVTRARCTITLQDSRRGVCPHGSPHSFRAGGSAGDGGRGGGGQQRGERQQRRQQQEELPAGRRSRGDRGVWISTVAAPAGGAVPGRLQGGRGLAGVIYLVANASGQARSRNTSGRDSGRCPSYGRVNVPNVQPFLPLTPSAAPPCLLHLRPPAGQRAAAAAVAPGQGRADVRRAAEGKGKGMACAQPQSCRERGRFALLPARAAVHHLCIIFT